MKYKGSSETILHKVLTVFFILIVPVFILTNFSLLRSRRDLSCQMSIDCFSNEKDLSLKSFVFLLYGEGDESTYEQNLHSILTQSYDQFRVIYFLHKKDAKFLEKLQQMATVAGKKERISFVHIETPLPTIDILRKTIESCKNEEVVVQLPINDWLAHENVLSLLNNVYANSEEIWLTYSPYLKHPSYQKSPLPSYLKSFFSTPKSPFLSSAFKTYYAGLFKQINPDFKTTHRKPLLSDSLDLYMVPMVDNAKAHIHFVKDALYVHPAP